jgi:cobalt-zinc-cadmium resistance protein CzcA
MKMNNRFIAAIVILVGADAMFHTSASAQKLSEAEAIQMAFENNASIKSAQAQIEYFRQVKKAGSDIGKLSAVWMRGQYNTIENDQNLTLTQSLPFPGTMVSAIRLGEQEVTGAEKNLHVVKSQLSYDVKSVFQSLLYQQALLNLGHSQDSLFTDFARASQIRYKTGESNFLESATAETQRQEVKNFVRELQADLSISQSKLQALLKSAQPVEIDGALSKREVKSDITHAVLEGNTLLGLSRQQVKIHQQEKRLEQSRLFPDFTVGYFNQTLIGYQNTSGQEQYFGRNNRFQGFMIGLSVPLWAAPQVARTRAASYKEEASRLAADQLQTQINSELEQALRELDKTTASLRYYEEVALKNANLILSHAQKAYKSGEIGYMEYLQALRNYFSIKSNYLKSLYQYNLSVIKLEFLSGKN